MEKRSKHMIIALAIIAALTVGAGAGLWFTPIISYPGGWEVQANLNKAIVNQRTYTEAKQPLHNYSWGDAYAKFDVDSETKGVPTLSVQLASPIEYVNVDGEWVKAREGETFKVLTKEVGDDVYFFYQHVFFLDVRIIAEADFITTFAGADGEARGMQYAIKPLINVYIEFNSSLWRVYDTITSDNGLATYKNSGVWAGVMSASVPDIEGSAEGSYVEPLPEGFKGIPGAWSLTNVGRLNMYVPAGSLTGEITAEDLQAAPLRIVGVPRSVYIEIAGTTLEPAWWKPPFGSVGVYAVQADYRIRGDIVTGAKYTFMQGDQDDTLKNASISDNATDPIGDWFRDTAEFLKSLAPNFMALGGFIIVVLVLVVFIRLAGRKRG